MSWDKVCFLLFLYTFRYASILQVQRTNGFTLISLAYAELFICLATVALRLGDRMELFETTEEDVVVQRDVFAMRPKRDTKGIRILVK
jgi:hypothetical protein